MGKKVQCARCGPGLKSPGTAGLLEERPTAEQPICTATAPQPSLLPQSFPNEGRRPSQVLPSPEEAIKTLTALLYSSG